MAEKKTKGFGWHSSSKSWRGRIGGKEFYWSVGKKTDKEARSAALEAFTSMRDRYRAGASLDALTASHFALKKSEQRDYVPPKYRLGGQVEEWNAHRKTLADSGVISFGRLESQRTALNRLREFLHDGDDIRKTNEDTINTLLRALTECMQDGRFSEASARQLALNWKQFYKEWCWKQGHLRTLPRNIDNLSVKQTKSITIEVYTPEELRRLYEGVKGTLNEAYFLLGLNCGYTAKDIADLTPSDLMETETGMVRHPTTGQLVNPHPGIALPTVFRICRKRSKTGQLSNHILWQATYDAIQRHRTTLRDDLLFTTKNGTPVVYYGMTEAGKTVANRSALNWNWNKYAPKLIPGDSRSFKHLRKTGATLVDRIQPGLGALYLAHAPKTIADKNYIPPNQEALDSALLEIERQLGFGVHTLESMFK